MVINKFYSYLLFLFSIISNFFASIKVWNHNVFKKIYINPALPSRKPNNIKYFTKNREKLFNPIEPSEPP